MNRRVMEMGSGREGGKLICTQEIKKRLGGRRSAATGYEGGPFSTQLEGGGKESKDQGRAYLSKTRKKIGESERDGIEELERGADNKRV